MSEETLSLWKEFDKEFDKNGWSLEANRLYKAAHDQAIEDNK